MLILGISAYYHDSAAALIRNGEVLCAAQEERFSRRKNDAGFPRRAIAYCLQEAGITPDQLDAVAYYEKPFLKFERLLETYYRTAPYGLSSFLHAMPVWLKEKLHLKSTLRRELRRLGCSKKQLPPVYFPEHHLSHAASTYYPSEYAEALILTVDGVGEYATTTICHGQKNTIERLRSLHFPHSLGLLYAAATYYLGFRINAGEYKVMGLAATGNPNSEEYQRFLRIISENLIETKPDGSFRLPQTYFRYRTGLRMVSNRRWQKLFGFPRRKPEQPILSCHRNLAGAFQQLTEEVMLNLAREGQRLTGSRKLCLAGGVALNCVANGHLLRSGLFDDIFVQPASGDAGGAIGAALATYYLQQPEASRPTTAFHPLLGPSPGASAAIELQPAVYADFAKLCQRTAKLLATGKTVGWVQDRMEFGPRALGNRSILADPRRPEMRDYLNQQIKNRELFRPFAPAVLAEKAAAYFNLPRGFHSPHMLFTFPVIIDSLPAITHANASARVQTVATTDNEKFHTLLRAFDEETGCPVLLNTSFNGRDEPIVATAREALDAFRRLGLDALVIGNSLYEK